MLIVLVIPIVLGVAASHRYLTLYAPSNVLIRRVRKAPPCWRMVGGLGALVGVLILLMRSVDMAIAAGAPGWLNVLALVLGWDALKLAASAIVTCVRVAFSRRPRVDAGVPAVASQHRLGE